MNGARCRNRTGTPLPARDFKSLVSTDFTNRASDFSAKLRRWRRVPESNRTRRICNPLHNRFVNAPFEANLGAGNETRTRDPDLGKVVLYQLSYSRIADDCLSETGALYVEKLSGQNNFYHSAFNRLAFRQLSSRQIVLQRCTLLGMALPCQPVIPPGVVALAGYAGLTNVRPSCNYVVGRQPHDKGGKELLLVASTRD